MFKNFVIKNTYLLFQNGAKSSKCYVYCNIIEQKLHVIQCWMQCKHTCIGVVQSIPKWSFILSNMDPDLNLVTINTFKTLYKHDTKTAENAS